MPVEACPYLELDSKQRRWVPAPSPHHRCFVQLPSERVGLSYQMETCLTTKFRQCPRLALATEDRIEPDAEKVPWSRPEVRRPELQRAAWAMSGRSRRPISAAEFVVLGLGVSIAFTFCFVLFIVFSRLSPGSGFSIAPILARHAVEMLPEPLRTLVPTFTPTPLPEGAPAESATPVPAEPAPEPGAPLPTAVVRQPALSPPTRLVIPKIGLDIPVVPVGTTTVQRGTRRELAWADVSNAGGFHQTSAYPGNAGNTVINGHRDIRGAVFRKLDKVEPGDEIIVYVGDVAYTYFAVETIILPETFASAAQRAQNLRYISYVPEERLTLVTCTPIGLATHRLLVIAKPPESIAPQMPAAGSNSGP